MTVYSTLVDQVKQIPPVRIGVLQCGCNNPPNEQGKTICSVHITPCSQVSLTEYVVALTIDGIGEALS